MDTTKPTTITAAIRAAAERLRGSITFVELIGVLERLRSKHKTPNQWYEGWNAAIDCLIRDATAATTPPPATSEQCTECRHKFCSDCEEACCKCDWPMRPAPSVPAGELHWPFAAKHENCAECNKEYEPMPSRARKDYAERTEPAPSSGDAAYDAETDAAFDDFLRTDPDAQSAMRQQWANRMRRDVGNEISALMAQEDEAIAKEQALVKAVAEATRTAIVEMVRASLVSHNAACVAHKAASGNVSYCDCGAQVTRNQIVAAIAAVSLDELMKGGES